MNPGTCTLHNELKEPKGVEECDCIDALFSSLQSLIAESQEPGERRTDYSDGLMDEVGEKGLTRRKEIRVW